MKLAHLHFFILLFLSLPFSSSGQQSPDHRFRVQLSGATGPSLHYNQPLTWQFCFEGCESVEDKPLPGSEYRFGLYYNIGHHQEIFAGLGWAENRFTNFAKEPPIILSDILNEEEIRFTYTTLHAGYRWTLPAKWLFVENCLQLEKLTSNDNATLMHDLGLSYILNAGPQIQINSINFHLSGFFKTALTSYNTLDGKLSYRPWKYGLEAALTIGL